MQKNDYCKTSAMDYFSVVERKIVNIISSTKPMKNILMPYKQKLYYENKHTVENWTTTKTKRDHSKLTAMGETENFQNKCPRSNSVEKL